MSSPVRPSVAIAFHSGYGHTAVLAEAVARGAASAAFHAFAEKSDIATAEQLGARVARQTSYFLAGRSALAAA